MEYQGSYRKLASQSREIVFLFKGKWMRTTVARRLRSSSLRGIWPLRWGTHTRTRLEHCCRPYTQVKEEVTGEKLVTNLLDWRKNQNEGRRGQKIRCKFSVNKKVRMFRVRLRSSFTLKEMEKKYSNNLTMETRRKFQNLIDKRKDEEIYFKIFREIGSAPSTWIG